MVFEGEQGMSEEVNQFLEIVRSAYFAGLVQEGDVVVDFCSYCKEEQSLKITRDGATYLTCRCKVCGHYSNVKKGAY